MAKIKLNKGFSSPRSLTAVSLLLIFGFLTVWAAGMYCLTSVTAEYAASRFYDYYHNYAEGLTQMHLAYDRTAGLEQRYENFEANRMWQAAAQGGRTQPSYTYIYSNSPFINRSLYNDDCYGVFAVFEPSGNMIVSSNEDFFFFEYMTEEQWLNGEERTHNNMRVFFDRDKLTKDARKLLEENKFKSKVAAMRFEGVYDGDEFIPSKFGYIDRNDFTDAAFYNHLSQHPVSSAVQALNLEWTTIYKDPAVSENTDTVTLYTDWFDMCYALSSPRLSYLGKKYQNTAELAAKLGHALNDSYLPDHEVRYFSGKTMIIPSVCYSYNIGDKTYYDDSYLWVADESKTLNFYTLNIIYCSPWQTAFKELRAIYIATFLLAVGITVLICSLIKQHLIKPAQKVGNALTSENPHDDLYPYPSRKWEESKILLKGFENHRKTFQRQNDEINRLNTALEYAKTAEENRRRMVSDIAHELKTPLAVIHSYAEGLKEHIAEDKREKYIDVILSETLRTDAMVLEMLDLSRLEAGKIKLMREPFSLIAATKAVFERLDIKAKEKNLKIEFDFPEDFLFDADESRITQVVENFAINAVKYTPEGGRISAKIINGHHGVSFSIENDSPPLSQDALSKVWEAFYRADESRSGSGTGLGLAIAKNIVELHGGVCVACNTDTGVKFGFII